MYCTVHVQCTDVKTVLSFRDKAELGFSFAVGFSVCELDVSASN